MGISLSLIIETKGAPKREALRKKHLMHPNVRPHLQRDAFRRYSAKRNGDKLYSGSGSRLQALLPFCLQARYFLPAASEKMETAQKAVGLARKNRRQRQKLHFPRRSCL